MGVYIIQTLHTEVQVNEALPIIGGSGSLVLCNTAVPDKIVMKPHSSDTILLAL